MDLCTADVVISMKFVPLFGDVKVVKCSGLSHSLGFLYEETNWSEHGTTLACFCLKLADHIRFLSNLLVPSCLNI